MISNDTTNTVVSHFPNYLHYRVLKFYLFKEHGIFFLYIDHQEHVF